MAKVRLLSLILMAALFGGCDGSSKAKVSVTTSGGSFAAQSRIINGSEVNRTESPQIVKILASTASGELSLCSGTVIGDNDVLTAGHCFPRQITAAVVEKPDGSTASINIVYIHPGYAESADLNAIFNDVAVAQTAQPLGLPALGIVASRAPEESDLIGIYGFGLDENQQLGVLRGGSMEVAMVTGNHIFARFDELSNTCNGDSGGPATYTIVDVNGAVSAVGVVGITSTGTVQNCAPGDLSLFTNLQHPDILSFIAEVVPEAVFH